MVLFAGGGTGGHLLPGVATAEGLRHLAPGARCVFATTDRDEAGAWAAAAGDERIPLASPRLPSGPAGLAPYLAGLAASLRDSVRALHHLRVDGVVGLGGYGSVGPTLAALATGRPAVVLEANVVPGAANRLLSALGATAAVSFEETGPLLPRGARAVVTGNPLRGATLGRRRDAARFGLEEGRPVLAVVGGSLGAQGLNARVAAALPAVAAAGAQLLWVTGPGEARVMEVRAEAAGVRASVLPFCTDMAALYGTADVLLARAGGGTVAEVAALGVAAIFVPYPHHADRQQAHNAAALAGRGAARVIEEADLGPEVFEREVLGLLRDPGARCAMARAALACGRPDAAERVARLVLERLRPAGRN